MTTFAEFGLSPELLKGVAQLGFETPTPVQAKVIPRLIKGEGNVVALAQTGTGKTAAFGLPLLQLTDPQNPAIQAVVLCPTRELCLQIAKDLSDFGRFAPHLRILAVYGGSSISAQLRALRRGVHILVATPGRMNDLLRRKGANLAGVQRVVLDEADEMLNMGFQEDLETILKEVPATARKLMFAATMSKQVASIAGRYMNDPEEIIIGRRNAGAENVTHECYTVHARDRYHALRRILDSRPGCYVIVFCRTRLETQEVAGRLKADGYNSDALHGDLSQDQRDRVMGGFRKRSLQVLVATDVAARGLDVDDLTHVINYDLPGDPDVYTHRSGRTGRAGKAGISIVLVHMREDYKIRGIERILNKRFEHKPVPTGREICEAQLGSLLERVKNTDPAEVARLDPYLPKINELLADMPREELVQRFVLGGLRPFMDAYANAPDVNVEVNHGHPDERPAQPGRPDRGERGAGPEARRGPFAGGPMVSLRVNVGKMNGLTAPSLIGLVNRATPGPSVKLGRIQILGQISVFEVAAHAARMLVRNLNGGSYMGRPLRCMPEPREGAGAGAPEAGPRHHADRRTDGRRGERARSR